MPPLAADFVEAAIGTGLVHIAPGHGADDWDLGQANALRGARDSRGGRRLSARVLLFAGGRSIVRTECPATPTGRSSRRSKAAGGLLARGTLTHSYLPGFLAPESAADLPHHATQWFILMDT